MSSPRIMPGDVFRTTNIRILYQVSGRQINIPTGMLVFIVSVNDDSFMPLCLCSMGLGNLYIDVKTLYAYDYYEKLS